MADEELPNDFNIIVIGTGLTESILSGALSRIGKRVLQLDHNKHYGSSWCSFNLKGFENWIDRGEEDISKDKAFTAEEIINKDTEEYVPVGNVRETIAQGETNCFLIPAKQEESQVADTAEDVAADITESKNDERDSTECDVVQKDADEIAGDQVGDAEEDNISKDSSVEKISKTSGIIKENIELELELNKAEEQLYTRESFYSSWRNFNLDLAPKAICGLEFVITGLEFVPGFILQLMFSRGKLVELLITSNVCRYLEFRNVTRTLTLLNTDNAAARRLAPVPCSRADVFASKFVTVIEKRMLMRVLTMCANYENHYEEYKDFENGRFVEFLAGKKLSKKLQHFILHSISMVSETTSTLDGLRATQKFLKSLGRYGNSAFLWPLYGVGELPQAFCRLGAVFGGTFCLQRSLDGLIIDKDSRNCVGIIDNTGQRLNCEHLIIDECYVPESLRAAFTNMVSRAIYVTDKSLLPSEKEHVSLITIPPEVGMPSSRLIEVGGSCCVCPPKLYVVHALTSIKPGAEDVLPSPQSRFGAIEKLLFSENQPEGALRSDMEPNTSEKEKQSSSKCAEDTKPRILWVSYFNMMSGGVREDTLPSNVHVTRGPNMDLGFDDTVQEARNLFETICPNEEFLPRAPNPEEIVYFDQDDEGYNTEGNGTPANAVEEEDGEYMDDRDEEIDAGAGEPIDDQVLGDERAAQTNSEHEQSEMERSSNATEG